jgi:hypothetical protein
MTTAQKYAMQFGKIRNRIKRASEAVNSLFSDSPERRQWQEHESQAEDDWQHLMDKAASEAVAAEDGEAKDMDVYVFADGSKLSLNSGSVVRTEAERFDSRLAVLSAEMGKVNDRSSLRYLRLEQQRKALMSKLDQELDRGRASYDWLDENGEDCGEAWAMIRFADGSVMDNNYRVSSKAEMECRANLHQQKEAANKVVR